MFTYFGEEYLNVIEKYLQQNIRLKEMNMQAPELGLGIIEV
ncbi:hypothetical protein [Granulicatella adiacens]|nr:hypothetical protein [Granulicatella adiacens]